MYKSVYVHASYSMLVCIVCLFAGDQLLVLLCVYIQAYMYIKTCMYMTHCYKSFDAVKNVFC